MKIDLNKSVLDLDGKEIENANMGKIVANFLVNESKGDPLKFWEWALKLNKGEVLDLDKSDQDTFKTLIKETEKLPIITKAQILEQLQK